MPTDSQALPQPHGEAARVDDPSSEPASPAGSQGADRPGSIRTIGAVAAGLGPLLLTACGGGSSSGGSAVGVSGGGTVAAPVITATQASRFLSQATIGYSKADITALAGSSFNAWLDAQFAMARPQRVVDFLVAEAADPNPYFGKDFDKAIWSQLMSSDDILRQRVGLALFSIWVTAIDGQVGHAAGYQLAGYVDGLWDNAFGNYRNLMEFVATSSSMGYYLTFVNSVKADPVKGTIPDENFARELMQLFTIGLYQLNMDGSPVLSGGAPVPTYTQDDVSQAARVWTGYFVANYNLPTLDQFRAPMSIDPKQHETGVTTLFNGTVVIPAGTDGATARKILLDALFNNPTMPPFICKQLIQHLVTSNPSPAYIKRVAEAFVNNGNGVRGDLKAVIRAILTDPEARDDTQVSSKTFGKLREPVVRLTQWARAFNVTSPTSQWAFNDLSSSAVYLSESPGRSPSVFNWFRPDYVPPGTAFATAGLVAPEFQLVSEPSLASYVNYMQSTIQKGAGDAKPDYSALTPLATDSQALLNELNLVLAANQISAATIAQMKTALDTMAVTTPDGINNRIYAAILLVMASPEYLVLR